MRYRIWTYLIILRFLKSLSCTHSHPFFSFPGGRGLPQAAVLEPYQHSDKFAGFSQTLHQKVTSSKPANLTVSSVWRRAWLYMVEAIVCTSAEILCQTLALSQWKDAAAESESILPGIKLLNEPHLTSS